MSNTPYTCSCLIPWAQYTLERHPWVNNWLCIVRAARFISADRFSCSKLVLFLCHQVVKDVAQNILSFMKSNCTREGHTYWLFKGECVVWWFPRFTSRTWHFLNRKESFEKEVLNLVLLCFGTSSRMKQNSQSQTLPLKSSLDCRWVSCQAVYLNGS